MKRFLALMFLCTAILVGTRAAHAQSVDETLTWLTDFIARNGGDQNGHQIWKYDIASGGSHAMYYSEIKTVENWHHGYQGGLHFVRVAGAIHDCSGYPDGTPFSVCPSSPGYFDIELKSSNDDATTDRMVKAFVHLAELYGAKVNQKEPF